MGPNPYQAPRENSPPPKKPASKGRSRLTLLLTSAAIGAVVGSVALAPFTSGPGDPFGHLTGAAMGTGAGLAIGFVLRGTPPTDAD